MKDAVIIKSYQNGINLLLNPEYSFDDLLKEIALKFSDAKAFFGNAKMAVSMEGISLSEEQQLKIVNTIHRNSNVQVVCIVGKDEHTEQIYAKAMEKSARYLGYPENGGQFYKGNLNNNQVIETESSIVILGDVCAGSAVISTKDIIILGSLKGEVYAGGDGKDGHFVVALEMAPERLKIGDFKYKYTKQIKWSSKSKTQPMIAYVKKDKVVLESLTKELLSTF